MKFSPDMQTTGYYWLIENTVDKTLVQEVSIRQSIDAGELTAAA